jgi:dienelactone hydrolase
MPTAQIKEDSPDDGMQAFGNGNEDVGLIFYPGGKVEYTAYVPLMRALAARGVFCVLLEMPLNLAVLDMNAADGVQAQYPDVERWYIGGHSLGGSMAASYLAKHTEDFDGIVLLGAYSTADLSTTSLEALSIFGSEDKVMNRGKYDKYKKNLPSDLTEIEIEGGCHAYFGMYGAQNGDGIPAISAQEQIYKTADYIWEFVSKGEK